MNLQGPSGRKTGMHIWLYAGTSWKIRNDQTGETVALVQQPVVTGQSAGKSGHEGRIPQRLHAKTPSY